MPPRVKPEEAVQPPPPVVYPHLQIVVCGRSDQTGVPPEWMDALRSAYTTAGVPPLIQFEDPLDASAMMALLGWEVESEGGEKFGDDFVLQDRYGRKVRLKNNPHNRPVSVSNVESIVQNVLQGRYELNGETFIVGDKGNVLNGQHTGIAVVLADQDRQRLRDKETGKLLWGDKWPDGTPVCVSKIVVYGIKETDSVVNTIDTAKPRSLADVLYRSPYFSDLPARNKRTGVDRFNAARSTDSAIKFLWVRTGLYMSNTSKVRTNSEAVAWLEGHGGAESKLLSAVRYVLGQNRGKGKEGDEGYVPEDRIRKELSLGQAAAFLYLMSCSNVSEAKVNEYYGADDRTSAPLTFGLERKARAFWEAFGKEDGPLAELTKAFGKMTTEEKTSLGAERRYMLCKAWHLFKSDEEVTAKGIKVAYKKDAGSGVKKLDWEPTFGGIDLGSARADFVPSVTVDAVTVPELERELDPDGDRSDAVPAEGEQGSDPTLIETSEPSSLSTTLTDEVLTEAGDAKLKITKEVMWKDSTITDVLQQNGNKKAWMAWGREQCARLAPYTKKKPVMHPVGIEAIAFTDDDVVSLTNRAIADGRTVALVVENVAPDDDEEPWTVVATYRPPVKTK